jgi:hypothetical protein
MIDRNDVIVNSKPATYLLCSTVKQTTSHKIGGLRLRWGLNLLREVLPKPVFASSGILIVLKIKITVVLRPDPANFFPLRRVSSNKFNYHMIRNLIFMNDNTPVTSFIYL